MKATTLSSLISLNALLFASSAMAHIPYVEGLDFKDVYDVKAPVEKSLALYMSFDNADDIDQIRFVLTEDDLKADQKNIVQTQDGKIGRKITFNTIVPRCDQYAGVLPKLALVGPTQAALTSSFAGGDLPFAVEGADGVFQLTNTVQGKAFQEKIAGTNYWRQNEASLILTEAGTYKLYIWSPSKTIGDYALVFGDQEIFGPAETVQALKRIAYLRSGMEIKDEACRLAAKK